MKVCPRCGERFPDDANFCPMDAAALAAEPEPRPAEPEPRPAEPEPRPAEPEPSPEEGLLGGRFRPLEEIDKTAIGERWRADDTREGRVAQLVYVAPEVFASPLTFERTQRELRQLEKGGGEGIGRVLDHGKLPDGRLWVATETPDGAALTELVAEHGPLPLGRACALIARVGEALLEAQKAGVIHRDVHPGNIRVLDDDRIKVSNFGLATPIGEGVFGEPHYLSPEQADGKPVDQRSNIFNLAAVLHFLVSGRPPLEGDTAAVLSSLSTAEPPALSKEHPELPAALDALLAKAMARSPTRRHLTLRQFVRDVADLGKSAPAAAVPASPPAAAAAATPEPAAAATPEPAAAAAPPDLAKTMIAAVVPVVDFPPPAAPEAEAPSAPAIPPEPLPASAPTPASAADAPPPASGTIIAVAPPVVGEPEPAVAEKAPSTSSAEAKDSEPAAEPSESAEAPAAASGEAPEPAPPADSETSTPPSEEDKPSAPGQRPGGDFRETAWFAKGDPDRREAATDGETASPLTDERPLEDRYRDDGSLSEEDAARLSLGGKTGPKRPAGVPVHAPPRRVPGERMDTSGIAREMMAPTRRRIVLYAGAALVVVLAALAYVVLGQ